MDTGNWADFQGFNAGYVAGLYEQYQRDPESVDLASRAFFEKHPPPEPARLIPSAASDKMPLSIGKIVAAANLAESIRKFGNLAAHLDPLGSELPGDPSLIPENYGLSKEDLKHLPASIISGPVAEGASNALEVIQGLTQIYCSHSGYDYAHLRDPEERQWLVDATEAGSFRPPKAPLNEAGVLERLTQEGTFELFLHRTFPGKTRFSIEGLGILIPVIDEIVEAADRAGASQILIGMGHRGRLNVLAHVLNKPFSELLAEFKDPAKASKFRGDLGWTGDVKYHSGARRPINDGAARSLVVCLAPNPSHLEAVDPVVLGMARAAGTRADRPGPAQFDRDRSLPLLIHGDAVFPAQGVVSETLNLFRLPGFNTGGTIHIIANNQIGFTTPPEEGRSTIFASDLARGFCIPIVHVNADYPEACLEAARLAFAYRAKFHKDFLIDLVGYRRYGHNEGDEPGFTQPLMYRKIAEHPTVRQLWAKTLLERGIIQEGFAEGLVRKHMESIQRVFDSLKPDEHIKGQAFEAAPRGVAGRTETAVPLERLRALNQNLLRMPEGFALHRKLTRAIERKRPILDKPSENSVDWASAEELAWASILEDGIPIRVTGQDVERGTFSQRHAAFHDASTGAKYIPLQSLPQAKASFELHNSPLSENAVLAFEYGYNVNAPKRLVIWEAQYGDFVTNAQTVIDEFIVSARAKWGLTPSLVLLLPHGFEGQGPDHSSGRPERFLSLAAAINLRLANCTTAAQYFHLLRRQALLLEEDPLPLIVLTPKSLLRHPLAASSPLELAEGRWHAVINDEEAQTRAAEIRRLILCSGKVCIDLLASPERSKSRSVAICRVEQLYPFPEEELKQVFRGYPAIEEIVWLQEEPRNMGAWEFARLQVARLINGRCPLYYVGRPRSSSPAEGSSAWHALNQQMIIHQAFEMKDIGAEETLLLKKA